MSASPLPRFQVVSGGAQLVPAVHHGLVGRSDVVVCGGVVAGLHRAGCVVKEYNSQIASLRAPVERLVAHFKNWKIFHTDYRRPYRTYLDAFDAARGLFFFSITWVLNNALSSKSAATMLTASNPETTIKTVGSALTAFHRACRATLSRTALAKADDFAH
jgi:hypothetical protein